MQCIERILKKNITLTAESGKLITSKFPELCCIARRFLTWFFLRDYNLLAWNKFWTKFGSVTPTSIIKMTDNLRSFSPDSFLGINFICSKRLQEQVLNYKIRRKTWDQTRECMFKRWKTHITYDGRENWSQVFPHGRWLSFKEDDKGPTSNDCTSSHSSIFNFLYCFTLDISLNLLEDRENRTRYTCFSLLIKSKLFHSLFFR